MNKIKTFLVYKILSIIKGSVSSCIKQIFIAINEHRYDKKLGIETSYFGPSKNKLAAFSEDIYKDGVDYDPTYYEELKEIVYYIKPGEKDILVDFGCGKGRVISFFATYSLKKIVGVELKKELIDVAQKNISNLRVRNTPVEIFKGDAVIFNVNEGTIFFLYKPFGIRTLIKVIDNIKNSLGSHPRKIRIVYVNPEDKYLDGQDWLVPEGRIAKTRAFVWHNRE